MDKSLSEKCCGCTACCDVCPKDAIHMKSDTRGFQIPVVDPQKCVDCGLCIKVCPLKNEHKMSFEQSYYVAKLKDEEKKLKSQSGGVFAAVAENILQRQGVVYGVVVDKKLDVVYKRATTKRDMYKMRGSKYVQAKVGDSYLSVKADLEKNKWVLFSGTPCYVHGLITFLSKYKTPTDKLITIDLVCHGVPSPDLYKQYLSVYSKLLKKRIRKFVFRETQFYSNCVFTDSFGNHYWTADYNKMFFSHLALRDCCYECNYSNFDRVGDLTIGDCWGYEEINRNFDPNTGCSLIIVNTQAGKSILDTVLPQFDYEETTVQNILQPQLQYPNQKPEDTEKFWSDFHRFGGEYVMRKYCDCTLDRGRRAIYPKEKLRRLFYYVKDYIYNAFEH